MMFFLFLTIYKIYNSLHPPHTCIWVIANLSWLPYRYLACEMVFRITKFTPICPCAMNLVPIRIMFWVWCLYCNSVLCLKTSCQWMECSACGGGTHSLLCKYLVQWSSKIKNVWLFSMGFLRVLLIARLPSIARPTQRKCLFSSNR